MELFGGVIPITGITFLMFSVFAIIALGYALGRITIKGISLESAGVFVMALLYGCFMYDKLDAQFMTTAGTSTAKNLLKIIENLGLILFVTSVGFIAGPKFFSNLKKNFKSYVMLGLIIILSGGLATVLCIFFGRNFGGETGKEFTAMMVGILSGALTSTPAFSAAKATAAELGAGLENIVSAGYAIAYMFGVIGVVLFVQLMPKLLKANMNDEVAKITQVSTGENSKKTLKKLIKLDAYGLGAFALAAVLGTVVGMLKIPLSSKGLDGPTFSLTTTGGCLLVALVMGHFARIGRISLMPDTSALKVFRELGLIFFLVGAGIPGGAEFVANFKPVYFVYGVIITITPMVLGFLFAKFVLKLNLLNALGSITGGMTSTPALGTLINVAKTEDVASAYAATYPIALIIVVFIAQFIMILM